MQNHTPTSDILLGSIGERQIRLSSTLIQRSSEHARQLAMSLGNREHESSLAGYWSLADRIHQWRRIIAAIGMEQAQHAHFAEIGSGLGLFTLVGQALGLSVVGIEASSDRYAESMQIARDMFFDNGLHPNLIQAFSETLPLADASIDMVTSFQTLEHVSNLAQTLREIRRILKPGGIFFAQAPNYTSFYEVHYGILAPLALGKVRTHHLLRLYRRPTGFLNHLQWLSPAQLRVMLQEVGFTSAHVGPIASTSSDIAFKAQAQPLPFRSRRGQFTRRIANRIALAYHKAGISADRYPQLEIWATA